MRCRRSPSPPRCPQSNLHMACARTSSSLRTDCQTRCRSSPPAQLVTDWMVLPPQPLEERRYLWRRRPQRREGKARRNTCFTRTLFYRRRDENGQQRRIGREEVPIIRGWKWLIRQYLPSRGRRDISGIAIKSPREGPSNQLQPMMLASPFCSIIPLAKRGSLSAWSEMHAGHESPSAASDAQGSCSSPETEKQAARCVPKKHGPDRGCRARLRDSEANPDPAGS